MNFFKKIKDKNNKIDLKVLAILFAIIYLGGMILSTSVGFLYNVKIDIGIKFLVNLVIVTLATIVFICFAWDKKLLNKLFWQIVFVLSAIWRVGSFVDTFISNNLLGQLDFLNIIMHYALVVGAVFFPIVILYLYAFRSDVWK